MQYASAPYGRYPTQAPQQEYVDVAGSVGDAMRGAGEAVEEVGDEKQRLKEKYEEMVRRRAEAIQAQQNWQSQQNIRESANQRAEKTFDDKQTADEKARTDLATFVDGAEKINKEFEPQDSQSMTPAQSRQYEVSKQRRILGLALKTNQITPNEFAARMNALTKEKVDYGLRAASTKAAKMEINNDYELKIAEQNLRKKLNEMQAFEESSRYMPGKESGPWNIMNKEAAQISKAIIAYRNEKGLKDETPHPLDVTPDEERKAKDILAEVQAIRKENDAKMKRLQDALKNKGK